MSEPSGRVEPAEMSTLADTIGQVSTRNYAGIIGILGGG